MRILRHSDLVTAPRERMFNLLENPKVADQLNPEWLRTEVVRTPWLPKPGETTSLRIRYRGVDFELETAIAEYRRGSFLLERQTVGPFVSFEHAVSLEDENGAVRITEVLAYAMRMGPLGGLFDTLALHRDLEHTLKTRLARLRDLFEHE